MLTVFLDFACLSSQRVQTSRLLNGINLFVAYGNKLI